MNDKPENSMAWTIWRVLFLFGGISLLAMAIFLPVELVVSKAISPAVRQQILARGTPERITFLENQFRDSLMWFRGAGGVLGLWLLLLGCVFPLLRKFDELRPLFSFSPFGSHSNSSSVGTIIPGGKNLLMPLVWFLLTVALSIPIITKGFEHEELLEMNMLAKRGVLVTAACQNQPPRAAQPAFTILESFAVRAFGDSEAVARFPAVVLGALVMFPLFFLAFRLGGARLANIACGLTATNGLFLFYINYARGYAFAMTMYLAAIYTGLLIFEKSTWRRWIAMGGFILIGVYAHMAVGVYIAVVCAVMLAVLLWQGVRLRPGTTPGQAREQVGVSVPRSSLIIHNGLPLLVRPVVVWGTVVLVLVWIYSIGVPASLDYLKAFDLTSYYMAYHINPRFLNVMLTLLAGLRMLPFWNWIVLAMGISGIIILFRKAWLAAAALFLPLLFAVILFYAKHLFVYPRYFIFFIPILCLFFAIPIASLTSLPSVQKRIKQAGLFIVWLLIVAVAVVNLQRLYAMERCGVRTAVEDAKAAMNPGDRIAGVLDGKVTVEHYYPGTVSMFHDVDFWRELNSTNPPEWIINVPYIEYDIPGGKAAIEKEYDLYREYPSWMDVDDDQDSIYLYRRKGTPLRQGYEGQAR